VIFLALEVLSLAVYVLTGVRRDSPLATEAAFKYFLLGGFSSAFFLYGIWRYWPDPTPYGLVGVLVLILPLLFMFVYVAVGPPLTWTMLAYALLWKNDRERQKEAAAAATQSTAQLRARLGARGTAARAQA